jgi:photosystem II stability/assembly factor-like uncharacterized protein
MIKTFYTISFLFVLLNIAFAQMQPWIKLQSPVNVTLRYLTFVDSLTGWAAGEAGTIIYTSDGGNNWELQNSTVTSYIRDIFFIDKNLGWAVTINDDFPFNSIMLKTTNSGDDWFTENFPDSTKYIRTIFFFDSLNGFVGGSYIGYTSDGGISWTSAEIDSNMVSDFPVYNFNFLNRQFGYACGGFIDGVGVIWRTTNSGFNWIAQGVSVDEVFDIFIFDSLNALTLSGDPEGLFPIAKITTNDSGEFWSNKDLPFFGLSFAIDFRTYNEGWSASAYKFLLTTNRGETWSEFETPDSAVVYDLQFTDARNGFAVGQNGVILKLDPTLVGVENESELPDEFILFQNYPNPFNPSTTIKYSVGKNSHLNISVYTLLGQKVAELINERLESGNYNVKFNGSGLSSGIYLYQLRTEEITLTKKMQLLK